MTLFVADRRVCFKPPLFALARVSSRSTLSPKHVILGLPYPTLPYPTVRQLFARVGFGVVVLTRKVVLEDSRGTGVKFRRVDTTGRRK